MLAVLSKKDKALESPWRARSSISSDCSIFNANALYIPVPETKPNCKDTDFQRFDTIDLFFLSSFSYDYYSPSTSSSTPWSTATQTNSHTHSSILIPIDNRSLEWNNKFCGKCKHLVHTHTYMYVCSHLFLRERKVGERRDGDEADVPWCQCLKYVF